MWQSNPRYNSCSDIKLFTVTTVLLITVIHAVQYIVTAPAPRDAVGTIQAQKLILSALLHTSDLFTKKCHISSSSYQRKPKTLLFKHVLSYNLWKQVLIAKVMYSAKLHWFIVTLWIMLSCTDLIWAIQAVFMSITPQAGWHTATAGTHILVHRARGDNCKREMHHSSYISFLSHNLEHYI